MRGQDFTDEFALLLDDEGLVFQRVTMLFFDQCGDVRIGEEELVEPGDLREHLQVGEILGQKIFFSTLRRITGTAKTLPQFAIAGIAADHVGGIGLEQILQRKTAFVLGQVAGGLGSDVEKRVLRGSRNVILNLGDQRWNEVEGLMDVGKLVQQFDHAVVVLEGVQAYPGQAVFAGDQIFIKGLVLMPKDNNAKHRHG